MSSDQSGLMEQFLDLSVVLTGFSKFNLYGTGQSDLYFSTVQNVIGADLFQELLATFQRIANEAKTATNSDAALGKSLRVDILGSERFGPIARNIIKLWYVATWYQLPISWRNTFGVREKDQTFVVSPQAYPEGLLWTTLGVNPPGARPQGYAMWSTPPTAKVK